MPALSPSLSPSSLPTSTTPSAAPLDGLRALVDATPARLRRAVGLEVVRRAIVIGLADVASLDREDVALVLGHATHESAILALPETHEARAQLLDEHARCRVIAGPASDLALAVLDAFGGADLDASIARLEDSLVSVEDAHGETIDGLTEAVDAAARSIGASELTRAERGTSYVRGTLDFIARGFLACAITWRELLMLIDEERAAGREMSLAAIAFLSGIVTPFVDVAFLRAMHRSRAAVSRFVTDEMDAGDEPVSLDEMLAANADDACVCRWLRSARPGDTFADGLRVTCVESPAA